MEAGRVYQRRNCPETGLCDRDHRTAATLDSRHLGAGEGGMNETPEQQREHQEIGPRLASWFLLWLGGGNRNKFGPAAAFSRRQVFRVVDRLIEPTNRGLPVALEHSTPKRGGWAQHGVLN